MNIETVAENSLKSFYKGDTLNIFYEFIGPDGNALDISGFNIIFSMKLNPSATYYGKNDIHKTFKIPFDGNSRKGLGEMIIHSKYTRRLIPFARYEYLITLVTPRDEVYTVGVDNIVVGANSSIIPAIELLPGMPNLMPKNANAQILIFDFSKLKDQQALFNEIAVGLRTSYSNQYGRMNLDTMGINKEYGLAGLDNHGQLREDILPNSVKDMIKKAEGLAPDKAIKVNSEAEMLALVIRQGDFVIRQDIDETYVNKNGQNTSMTDWVEIETSSIIVSDIPPKSPISGQQWFNTKTGLLGTWYQGSTIGQWVAN